MPWVAMIRCKLRVLVLLARRRLHVRRDLVGRRVPLPDGRTYVVFRHTTRDPEGDTGGRVLLAVWFRLRLIPPGAALRRALFERACIVNTLLFAGFDGYLVKLWMVDRETSDFAGLYSWRTAAGADTYARYITAVLRPLSVSGSVGYRVHPDRTLEEHLRVHGVDPPV